MIVMPLTFDLVVFLFRFSSLVRMGPFDDAMPLTFDVDIYMHTCTLSLI